MGSQLENLAKIGKLKEEPPSQPEHVIRIAGELETLVTALGAVP